MKFKFTGDSGRGLVAERLTFYAPNPVTGLLTDRTATAIWPFAGVYNVTLDYVTHSPDPATFVLRRADGTVVHSGKLRAVNHFARLSESWQANDAASLEITGYHVLITSVCTAS